MKKIILLLLTIFSLNLYSQVPEPVSEQKDHIILFNGIIHDSRFGGYTQYGWVSFKDGKIDEVRKLDNQTVPAEYYDQNTILIDLDGKHVYPGLILPNSKVGLEDISAVRATVDHTEIGDINSNIRSLIAYNTDSEIISTFRYNGILLSQVVPDGDLITGNSSIMMMEGWNWEDAAYKIDDGMHIKWPRKTFPPNRWTGSTEFRENPNYRNTIDMVHKFLIDSRAYYDLKDKVDGINLKLESMIDVFSGKKKVYIHANTREQIIESVQAFKRHGINNLVIVGANDAYYAIDFLKENNLPVLLNNLHRVPSRNHEDVDLPYKLPYLLHKEGILVGLTASGSLHSQRNLPFLAGTAAGYGLSKSDALKMITYNNAKILGIDNITGSLEVGKDANIIVSEGDILDMRSSKIEMAFIKGKKINLNGKQQILYDRFKRKYSE
ncbi:MAG: amidohydrolase family protein [Bacteroidota bacterium]|nr:amidohydrolase family protein [Bacteroidota bacterium]